MCGWTASATAPGTSRIFRSLPGSRGHSASNQCRPHRTIPLPRSRTSSTDPAREATRPPTNTGPTEPFLCPSFLCQNPEPPARTRLPRPPALQPIPAPPNHSSAPHSSAKIPNPQHGPGSRGRSPSNQYRPHRTIPPPLIPLPSAKIPNLQLRTRPARPLALQPIPAPPNHSSAPHSSAKIPNLQHGPGSRGRSPSNQYRPHRTIPPPLIPLPSAKNSNLQLRTRPARPLRLVRPLALQPIPAPPNHSSAPHSSALCQDPEPPASDPARETARPATNTGPTEPFLCPSFLCPLPRSRTSSTDPARETARPPTNTGPTEPFLRPSFLCPLPRSRTSSFGPGPRDRSPCNQYRPHRTIPLPLIPLPSAKIPNLQLRTRPARPLALQPIPAPTEPFLCPSFLCPLPRSRTSSTDPAREAARPATNTGPTEPFLRPSFLCPLPRSRTSSFGPGPRDRSPSSGVSSKSTLRTESACVPHAENSRAPGPRCRVAFGPRR